MSNAVHSPKHLIYLHGFNSSNKSLKAEQTGQFLRQNYPSINFICPQLESQPNMVISQVEQLIATLGSDEWCLMGSSLGGYFASYFSERFQKLAVLINPAVKPYELLQDYLGEQVNPYTGLRYQVALSFIEDLKKREPVNITKSNYFVLVQTDDEVLPYQQAVERFSGAKILVEQGGDHSFVNFQNKLPDIAKFLQIT